MAEDEQGEDEILTERAGELGAAGGAIGGSIGGSLGGGPRHVARAAAGRGGRSGARFAARFLNRTDVRKEEVGVPAGLDPMARAEEVLRELAGEPERLSGEGGTPRLRGVVGAGWFDLNPVVVTIGPAPRGRLTVRAAAKEGLIKQRAAEQAMRRVAAELTRPPESTPPTDD